MEERICSRWAGREWYDYEEIDSTNEEAKRLAAEGAGHGAVVLARRQSAGKGRRGRSWQSPEGKDIYFTILLKPDFAPNQASGLTLVMALAVTQAIETYCGIRTGIKWPNDVVVNGRKVCGILTEMSMEANCIQYVIIGVGINVNRNDSPEEISEELRATATSLYLESKKLIDKGQLLQEILRKFENCYEQYVKSLNMEYLLEDYNARLVNRERQVRVLDPKGEWEGIAHGINAEGELLVEAKDGTLVEVYAGEVSVRGLYGYV